MEPDDIPTFAARIKSKYPEYKDIADHELVERTVRKHPAYADKVKLPSDFSLLQTSTGYPKLDEVYDKAGRENNVDPNLLIEQGRQETINFNPDVVYGRRNSPKGAQGAGQFMPDTAPKYGVNDRTDPVQSIHGQAKYMRKLLDQFDNNEQLALAGYNSGEYRKSLANGQVPKIKETQDYVKIIGDSLAKARSKGLTLKGAEPTPTVTPRANIPIAPEAPQTIAAQAQAAADPTKPRAAVLLNPGEDAQNDPKWQGFGQFTTNDGRSMMVNLQAAKKLGLKDRDHIQNYILKNPRAMETFGIHAETVQDTSQGTAVHTTAPDGTELNSSIVTTPQTAEEQMSLDQANHPGAVSQVVDAQDVVQKRLGIQPETGTTPSILAALPPEALHQAVQGGGQAGQKPFVNTKVGSPALDEGQIEAQKEQVRQDAISKQKTQAIQQVLKPQPKVTQYDFQKNGKLTLPAVMGETGSQDLTYEKDPSIEKNGEYRLKDADGNPYIYSPTTGKIVDETDSQVLKKIEIPLAEKGTPLSTAKQTQAAIVSDAIAADHPEIPKQDIADYFKQRGFSDLKTGEQVPDEHYFRGGFTNPVTGVPDESIGTDFFNLTQRELNRIEAFSQDRQQQTAKYQDALKTAKMEGNDDFSADLYAKADAGMISQKDVGEILAQKRQMRQEATDALKAENSASMGAGKANLADPSKPYEPSGAEIDAKLKEMTSPENIAASQRIQKRANDLAETFKSWGLGGQAAKGASAAVGGADIVYAGALRPFSWIPGIADEYKDMSERGQARLLAFDLAKDDSWVGWGLSHGTKVVGDLIVLAALNKVPGVRGRTPTLFAVQSGLSAAGTGKPVSEVAKSTFGGYSIGKVFEGATAIEGITQKAVADKGFANQFEKGFWNELSQYEKDAVIKTFKESAAPITDPAKRVLMLSTVLNKVAGGTVLIGGTAGVAQAEGSNKAQTIDQIATNLLFHFGGQAASTVAEGIGKVAGRISRIWKDGKSNDYYLNDKGQVERTVDPVPQALVENETVLDPENPKYRVPSLAEHLRHPIESLKQDKVAYDAKKNTIDFYGGWNDETNEPNPSKKYVVPPELRPLAKEVDDLYQQATDATTKVYMAKDYPKDATDAEYEALRQTPDYREMQKIETAYGEKQDALEKALKEYGVEPQVETVNQPETTPQIETKVPAQKPIGAISVEDIKPTFQDMGKGITENLHNHLWNLFQKGETKEAGAPSNVLILANKARVGLQDRATFDRFVQDYGDTVAGKKNPDFQKNANTLISKYTSETTPKAESPPDAGNTAEPVSLKNKGLSEGLADGSIEDITPKAETRAKQIDSGEVKVEPKDVLDTAEELVKQHNEEAARPQPYSTDALKTAFNLSNEQAHATDALVKAMGLDTSKINVVKGGKAGGGALHQDSPSSVGMFKDIDALADLPKEKQQSQLLSLKEKHGADFERARYLNASMPEIIRQAEEKGVLKKVCP